MSLSRRLRLDNVVASFPELGPTVPDGGYSWVILSGVLLIQMTIPSVPSMYGIVFAFIGENKAYEFDLHSEQIILTPILFTAFWNLADPWTRMMVNLASIPRLVGIIGVILLAIGIIASGYLATGGVGAYLASSSAGAVMGVGASFIITLSDFVLRKYFRKKLLLALTLRNIATSVGLVVIPALTNILLHKTNLKLGLLLMTTVLLPMAIGILTFRVPTAFQHTSPYSLLLSNEEDNELPIRISEDISLTTQSQNDHNDLHGLDYVEAEETMHAGGLYSEENNIYAYEEPKEDVDVHVNPVTYTTGEWSEQFQVLKSFRFWATLIGWTGMKVSTLFFWILLPTLSFKSKTVTHLYNWMVLSVVAGFATFIPSCTSYKVLNATTEKRKLYFGVTSLLCSISLIGLAYVTNYSSIMIFALVGGMSIGSLTSCQDLPLYDIFTSERIRCIHKIFSTLVGLSILSFCFVYNTNLCLQLAAFLQIVGGCYWIVTLISI